MLAIAALTALSAPAYGQEPDIVDACLKAAQLQLSLDDLVAVNVQAFPELSPPRVRMDVERTAAESGNRISDLFENILETGASDNRTRSYGEVRCEFENSTAPFGITDFVCFASGCGELYIEPELKSRRLEELQVLLAREGY